MEVNTFSVYRGIIDEVLEKVRADFQAEGADERVLDDLRMMWENKLLMTSAIQPAGVLVEEARPQAALEAPPQNVFFPTDLNLPPPPDLPTQDSVSVPQTGINEAGGRDEKPSTSANEGLQDVKRRRLSELGPGLENPADGLASASVPPVGVTVGADTIDGWRIRGGGGGDEDDEEDYNEEEPEKPPEVKEEVSALEELEAAAREPEEDDLNELDDEEEQKEEEDDGAEATANIVLAQFEKVTRSKNKWKCTLKEGVIKLNGRDILFNKANGEFVW